MTAGRLCIPPSSSLKPYLLTPQLRAGAVDRQLLRRTARRKSLPQQPDLAVDFISSGKWARGLVRILLRRAASVCLLVYPVRSLPRAPIAAMSANLMRAANAQSALVRDMFPGQLLPSVMAPIMTPKQHRCDSVVPALPVRWVGGPVRPQRRKV
ncbi:hypothetical protein P154DRAFT_618225 [Amniculicola lignicola CBS 123094]|uniref:Uncharacterized protein n=1 Tax=Amniculicola lignicola CBS 123094 TaxID=1392246 RepID=A0A6A5WLV8_9PLEO|nr:hypothetical protein P154DRAFT_618225 [Amniculicola lignicola CBS 123094]